MDPELEKLVIKLIQEDPTWGSNRMVGVLDNPGLSVSDSTIDNIRHRNGLDPAPVRGKSTSWHRFVQAHWETLIADDFFTTEVLSWNGLVTYDTLLAIELRLNHAGFAISSKERPSFAMTGYARQKPWVPRKSGKPESTPIPAPAVTSRASAALMATAACLTLSSMLVEPTQLLSRFSRDQPR